MSSKSSSSTIVTHRWVWALIRGLGLTPSEIKGLIQEALQEAEEKKILHRRQFDVQTMRYLALEEWVKEYFKE